MFEKLRKRILRLRQKISEKIKSLEPFDMEYFEEIEGKDSFLASKIDFKNIRYFTVIGENKEKLGIIGLYDVDEDKNVTHIVVDPKYRGRGLAKEFYDEIMKELGEDSIITIVNLDNRVSLRAHEKMPGIKIISDEDYEKKYHKRKFKYGFLNKSSKKLILSIPTTDFVFKISLAVFQSVRISYD